MLPLATDVAREEGLHERSSYLISPDDLPSGEGEGALPVEWHYQRMAYAIYITSKDDLNVSKLPSDHFFRLCALLIL